MVLGRLLPPVLLLGLLGGCGGTNPAPAPPPPAAKPEPAEVALPPLVKVGAPAELFAVARAPNAAKTADTGVAWSGLPLNWRSLLDKAIPGLEAAAVLSAPIDFAATLDPRSVEEPHILWAFSAGAPSTEAAAAFFRSQGAEVEPEAGGSYRVRVSSGLVCQLVRALGTAPARVVCSENAFDVEALTPYMSCGMPTESFGEGELHAHIVAEPFRRRYGSQATLVRTMGVPFLLRELSLDHPKFDRALRDVLYGLADEVIALAYDLDRIDMDTRLAPGGNSVDLTTSLTMAGQRSWSAQTVAAMASRGTAAPDSFWKLPMDAESAGYGPNSDPERTRAAAAALRELADGWLDYHKLPERRRTPLVEALEQLMTSAASTAQAVLPSDIVAPAERGHTVTPDSVRAAIGEHLFVVDRSGDRFSTLASELVKALGDKSLREHLAKSNVVPADRLPTARERAPKFGKGLPPKTRVFELQIPGAALAAASAMGRSHRGRGPEPVAKPEKPGEGVSAFLVVMTDGALTWFAVGSDEKAIEERLAAIKAGTGQTLASREGLAALKTETAMSAGFWSLAGLLASARSELGDRTVPSAKSLEMLPHRGGAPILWRVASDATGPKVTASARVPRELVEDLVGMAASSAASMVHK